MKSEEASTSSGREPIAIVGIGCRYPGVRGAEQLWDLLMQERDVISEVPKERFDIDSVYDPRSGTRGKLAQRGGGFLEGVLDFDPEYFHISPREAAVLDPQQRLLLEVTAEAFDDAWLGKEELARHTTGVYVGCWTSDWESHEYAHPSRSDIYSMNGSIRCMLSGRVSYAFDLRGPSMTVDAGCSAALLGVHLACQSLWLGECSMALASGVNLILDSKYGITFSQGGMLAADSRCKAFAAEGDGFVRSDGCAALVLMPLSAAQARGARIYGLIRGTGASNDGFSNGLLATPSEIGQQLAIRAAYRSAQLTAADVQYVEAHGTGTRAGDPVELRALSAIMQDCARSEPCWVGSVKSNLGHTEAVAGISGMIKTLLSLSHRTIPRSLHAQQPTSAFDWEGSGLRVANARQAWPDVPVARAGVSSFGLSGTDVHVLLEEPPRVAQERASTRCRAELLLLSAASEPALHELARAHRAQLSEETDLYALCRSAALGRHHHEHRLSLVASDPLQLSEALAAVDVGEPHPAIAAASSVRNAPQPVFVFSGQGSQCDAMARELYESDPAFRSALTACDRALSRYASWSLLAKITAPDTRWSEQPIDVIQPAIFAVQVALARSLEALGILPAMIVGHSMGEVAAAHIAGAITLDDAALIIVTRSQNLQAIAGRGGMLSVELSFAEAEAAIADYRRTVGIAASNSAQATVLAGDCDALASIASMLRARGVFCREVAVDAAAHSPQLDPLLPEFARKLRGVAAHSGTGTPVFSTVTAGLLPASAFDAAYWVRNQREPVRFNEAIEALIQAGHRVFVEIAPHPILLGPIQQTLSARRATGETVGLQRRAEPQRGELLRGLGRLHALGQGMSLPQLFAEPARFVPLPRYPFQRERCGEWPPYAAAADSSSQVSAPLRSALHPSTYVWEIELGSARFAYLRDHQVGGEVVPPGAFYADLALVALRRCLPEHSWCLEDVKFVKALTLPDGQPTRLQVTLEELQPGSVAIGFYTAAPGASGFELHASARGLSAFESPLTAAAPAEISARCEAWAPAQYVQRCAERTIGYGPAFQCFRGLWLGATEALAQIELPSVVALEPAAHSVHPVLLDAALQAGLAWAVHNRPAGGAYVPVAIERMTVQRTPGAKLWAHAQVRPESDAQLVVCDVALCEPDGTVAVHVTGLTLRRLEQQRNTVDDALYALRWQEREAALRPRKLSDQTWLVLADRTHGVAAQLKRALEREGARCVLGSAEESATTHLRKAAADPRRPLRGVISLWALDCKDPFTRGEAALADMLKLGPLVLTELTQAVAASRELDATALWVVTAGAQRVNPGDLAAVEQAPVWALARTVRSEFPRLEVHAVDLSAQVSQVEVAALIHEITHVEPGEQVALRGTQRHVLQLLHEVPLAIDLGDSSPLCRSDGTYLVTGGLGALGMLVAEHLVEQGARHLVLLGRGQPKPAVAERLSHLRERGIEVRVVACDVSQREDLEGVFALIAQDLPALRGVVHAAGVLDDGVTLQLTAERFERVMAPKVLGAFHLHQLTLKHTLDFFVLFSSAASVLGNPGQGNYASANEFMDALAQRRREQGLPALSINWGPWNEAGLAATPDRAERLASRGLGSLTDAAGIATLERLLRSDAIQAVVLPDANFQTWKHWYPGTASMLETLLSQARASGPTATAEGELGRVAALAKLSEHERLQAVEQYLVDVTRRVLRMSPTKSLARDQSLNRLGLDSLMAVELKNRIDADLAVTLPVSKVLLCSGLCHLASEVASQIAPVTAPETATDLDLYSYVDSSELFDELDEPAQHCAE